MLCCVILFNNEDGVYYGGQIMSGIAELTTLKEKTIRGIHITIDGYASVNWSEKKLHQENGKTVRSYVPYTGRQQFISTKTYVLGSEDREGFQLAPGKYSYEFQLALPHQVPGSFEGKYGHICYQVIVTVDCPWGVDNVFKKHFTVLSSLDLNTDHQYKKSLYVEDEKDFCFSCCTPGHVTAKVYIPFSGYAHGENIPVSILIDNRTTTECSNVKIKLERHDEFIALSPEYSTKNTKVKIKEKELGPVLVSCKKDFNELLELPSVPPTSLTTCSIIRVSYIIHVTVYTKGFHSNMEMMLPITIGTVPFYESEINPTNVITIQPSTPHMSIDQDSPSVYNPIVPPSLEEAVSEGKKIDDEDTHATIDPVNYNFAQPSAPGGDDSNVESNLGTSGPTFHYILIHLLLCFFLPRIRKTA